MRSLVLTGAVVWLYCCWAADGFSFRYRQRQRSLRSTTSFLDSSRFGIVRLATKAPSDVDEPPKTQQLVTPDILKPFHPASDHMWMCRGPVGQEGFVLNRENGPVSEELTNENILKIVKIECSDLEVNTLVWKCLGYRFNSETEEWSSSECFPNWREMYPTPPDFIGMQRIYSPEIDKPSLKANQALVKSIPVNNKQSLKEHLKPLGFRGYQYSELTPNKTRRAQCANWLIFFREELFGYTVEELRERRKLRLQADALRSKENGTEGEWKPPVSEVI